MSKLYYVTFGAHKISDQGKVFYQTVLKAPNKKVAKLLALSEFKESEYYDKITLDLNDYIVRRS